MSIKEFLQRKNEKSEAIKKMIEEERIRKAAEDRMKSSEERQLEDYMKKEREKQIKARLERFKERDKKMIFGGGLIDKKNIFKNHKPILTNSNMFGFRGGI